MTTQKEIQAIVDKLTDETKHKDEVSNLVRELTKDEINRLVWNNPKTAQQIMDDVFREEEEKKDNLNNIGGQSNVKNK